jgi:hypothetical protein
MSGTAWRTERMPSPAAATICSRASPIVIPGCRVLNGGVENLPLADAITRLNELSDKAPLVAGVLAPPRRALIPEVNRVTRAYEGDWEAAWETEFARLRKLPVMAFLMRGRHASAMDGEEAPDILDRFDRFLEGWCARKQALLLIPGEAEGGLSGLGRMLGLSPKARPGLTPAAALIEQRLAKPVQAYLKAHPDFAAAPVAAAQVAGGHGPEDVGRNYPLW